MAFELRKKKILAHFKENEFATVSELAALLAISEITVRRDLEALQAENQLQRIHGGAARGPKLEVNFSQKIEKNIEAKAKIGFKAAQLVKKGEVIFLDCGSTTLQMCEHLQNIQFTLVTNSLPIVQAMTKAMATIVLIGGELDQKRLAIHGIMASWNIAKYHFDKAFIGADAIDDEGNLWAHSELEAGIGKGVSAAADEVYVLADSSKYGHKSLIKFATSTEYHQWIQE